MSTKVVAKIFTEDLTLNRIQDNLKSILDPVLANPVLDGHIIGPIALVSGTNLVEHELGRNYKYWLVLNPDAAAMIYEDPDNTSKQLFIKIISDISCNASFLVF